MWYKITFTLFLLSLGLLSKSLYAQGSEIYGSGLKVNLDDQGTKYIRFITWHQTWTRYSENNTGSTISGQDAPNSFDIGLRRSRFLAFAQLNEKFLILTHFGINNQSNVTGGISGLDGKKPHLYMHDAWTEYSLIKDKLHIGTGLHYWNGISRLNNASTINFMTLDAPIFNWATIETTDQFARFLGAYAKGKLGKLDYRIAVNSPFATNIGGDINPQNALHNPAADAVNYAGYFNYQFLEQESNLLPYAVGTYVGTKKIFNLGFGFLHHGNATWTQEGSDTSYHDMNLFAVDAFLDYPFSNGYALTAYTGYFFYDYGPNYIRNIGIMNPATGGPLAGNAMPLIGTGNAFHLQAGLLLPPEWFNNKVKIQPYTSITDLRYEALENESGDLVPNQIYEGGVNFYLEGHHAKITLNYRNRPDFVDINHIQRRNEIILQTTLFF